MSMSREDYYRLEDRFLSIEKRLNAIEEAMKNRHGTGKVRRGKPMDNLEREQTGDEAEKAEDSLG